MSSFYEEYMFFRHLHHHEALPGRGREDGPFGRLGRHRGGIGPREGRMFDGGEFRLVILALIAEKPRHGYEVIKALGERVGGDYSPSPGVVYPTLTLLETWGCQRQRRRRQSQALHDHARGPAHLTRTRRRSTPSSPGCRATPGKGAGAGSVSPRDAQPARDGEAAAQGAAGDDASRSRRSRRARRGRQDHRADLT